MLCVPELGAAEFSVVDPSGLPKCSTHGEILRSVSETSQQKVFIYPQKFLKSYCALLITHGLVNKTSPPGAVLLVAKSIQVSY